MLKVTHSSKINAVEVINDSECLIQASYNSNGTITLKGYPCLYEGKTQTVILGRAETVAIFELMKKLQNID
ncbi:MAG TPA: hypothetical protein IAB90_02190 [Candidatus Coproplasma stercoripullorum]|uniref:Uncharacterized protein n=1 Tax=Candidatus Coproplasma stercoripullorum TaxID=2840751 RepID=A0A9D1AFQ5_9FIRM|nr:hypothetical protein [Candidatus Coproplasma stercoripullorum]